MNPAELIRWVCLAVVFGACFLLWNEASPNASLRQAKNASAVALAVPDEPSTYNAPDDLKSPFPSDEREMLAMLALRQAKQGIIGGKTGATSTRRRHALHVDGIFWSRRNPLVSINNKLLHLGEKYHGVTILRVNPESVVVDADGRRVTLSINPWQMSTRVQGKPIKRPARGKQS